jgi:hypothetical protein
VWLVVLAEWRNSIERIIGLFSLLLQEKSYPLTLCSLGLFRLLPNYQTTNYCYYYLLLLACPSSVVLTLIPLLQSLSFRAPANLLHSHIKARQLTPQSLASLKI